MKKFSFFQAIAASSLVFLNDTDTKKKTFNFAEMTNPERVERASALNAVMDEIDAKYSEDKQWSSEDTKAFQNALEEQEALTVFNETSPEGLRNRRASNNLTPAMAQATRGLEILNNSITSIRPALEDDPRGGFRTDNEFLLGVANFYTGTLNDTSKTPAHVREAMVNAVGTDEYASLRSQDGVRVPRGILGRIIEVTPEDDGLLGRLPTAIPIEGMGLDINARVDKDHRTSYTGGTTVSRIAETKKSDYTKDTFEAISLKPAELIGQSAVTKAMLRQSPISVPALIENSMDLAFLYRRREELISGDGNGKYLGFLSTNNKAVVDVETRAASSTSLFTGADVLKMRKHVWRYDRAVWVFNMDLFEHVAQLHVSTTDGEIIKLFSPAQGDVPDTLLGRPVIFSEFMPGLGSGTGLTIGDLGETATKNRFAACVNLDEMLYGLGWTEEGHSVHVRWEEREEVFQFVMADDCRPAWKTYLQPAKGRTKLSPFVAAVASS